MKTQKLSIILFLSITTIFAQSENKSSYPDTAQMKDLMNDRFGMFIHWGPVTLRATEIAWSRNKDISIEDYDNLYKEFNPVLFDAEEWVKAAKDGGMKYLTITAKHHDGFCLWPSAFTDYDIASTPYKKDIIGPLQKACKKYGIKFCIYYSVIDWYHPEYSVHFPKQTPDPKSDINKYNIYMKNQLKELIIKYDPYMLWFDGGSRFPWTDSLANEMYSYLKKLKPTIVINNRLGAIRKGKGMVGDYLTPEQKIGKLDMDAPWESCFTICDQWSWKPNDKMKPLKECLDILASTAGGNGNLLLNVGPMPDGRIEARQVKRLIEVGDWLKLYGESIYNTKGGPWAPNETYSATRKVNKIYLHLLSIKDSQLVLPALPNQKIIRAYVLKGPAIAFKQDGKAITLSFPSDLKDITDPVIVLELDGNAEAIPVIVDSKEKALVKTPKNEVLLD